MGKLIDLGKARKRKEDSKEGFLVVRCPECDERMKYYPTPSLEKDGFSGWRCSKCGHEGV